MAKTPEPSELEGRIRNLLGLAALAPAAVGGLAVGLAAQNQRAGVNFLLNSWLGAMFALNGVSFVVSGRDHLWWKRPAVFLFNQRSRYDAFMAAWLVERDFTGVGKLELAMSPLLAGLGKLVDDVWVEWDETPVAIEQRGPAREAVAKGMSLLISPEAAQVENVLVGPFQKGPFRIAMAAHLPLVPIVIRNAEDVASRDDSRLRPGVVEIHVLPPIPTGEWTLEDLPKRIDEVRQRYVDTLEHWPSGGPRLRSGS